MSWLDALAPGHTVIVSGRSSDYLRKVEKVTKFHVVVDGEKYRRAGGYKVGAGLWDSVTLREATPAAVAQIRDESAQRAARRVARDLSDFLATLSRSAHDLRPHIPAIESLMARLSEAFPS